MSIVGLNNRGFTLIEVVVTIIIAAIMGGIVLSFVRSANLYSVNSMNALRGNFQVVQVMERINAEYRRQIETHNFDFDSFLENVEKNSTQQVQVDATNISIVSNKESDDNSNRIMKVKVISKDTGASVVNLFTS